MATAGSATAAATAARAVAMAFLALTLTRPLSSFPTRVGWRKLSPITFPPTTTLLVLKQFFKIARAAAHGFLVFVAISTGRPSTIGELTRFYGKGVPLVFLRFPQFWSLIPMIPKPDLEKHKTATG